MCTEAHDIICKHTYHPRQEEGMLVCYTYVEDIRDNAGLQEIHGFV